MYVFLEGKLLICFLSFAIISSKFFVVVRRQLAVNRENSEALKWVYLFITCPFISFSYIIKNGDDRSSYLVKKTKIVISSKYLIHINC